MPDVESAVTFVRRQIQELEIIRQHAAKAVNAVLAKEQFQKWKKQSLQALTEHVGAGYAQALSRDWLEATFPGGDMYEELEDDIEMCLRHLKKLLKEIETHGLEYRVPTDTSLS